MPRGVRTSACTHAYSPAAEPNELRWIMQRTLAWCKRLTSCGQLHPSALICSDMPHPDAPPPPAAPARPAHFSSAQWLSVALLCQVRPWIHIMQALQHRAGGSARCAAPVAAPRRPLCCRAPVLRRLRAGADAAATTATELRLLTTDDYHTYLEENKDKLVVVDFYTGAWSGQ